MAQLTGPGRRTHHGFSLNYNDSAEGTQVLIDPVTGDWTKGVWNDNAEPDWQRLAP